MASFLLQAITLWNFVYDGVIFVRERDKDIKVLGKECFVKREIQSRSDFVLLVTKIIINQDVLDVLIVADC